MLSRLLCRMFTSAGVSQPFTSVMLNINTQSPIHRDSYNRDVNILLPVRLPSRGGRLWLELAQGDQVTGTVEVREVAGQQVAGHNVPLAEGTPVYFDPRRRHATEPWPSGARVILAAHTTGSVAKATGDEVASLRELGFPVPDESGNGPSSSMLAEQHSSQRQLQSPQQSSEVQSSPASPGHKASGRKHVTQGYAAEPSVPRRPNASFLPRVLLITLFHASMSTFLDRGWQPVRLRPVELLRDGFDNAVLRLKQREFACMWIDLTDPRSFAGVERTNQVCQRITTLMSTATRHDVPICLAADRRGTWQHTAFEQLTHNAKFTASYHCWCRFSAKMSPLVHASSVKLKVLSTVRLPSHDCRCPPGTEHTFDIDIYRGSGSSAARAKAHQQVLTHIVAALEKAVGATASPESTNSPDPMCNDQSMSFACTTCGLSQAGPFCLFCQDTTACVASQEQPVADNSSSSSQVNVISTSSGAESAAPQHPQAGGKFSSSYPTEQKIAQRERQLALGPNAPPPREKKKVVEQHFDDCGEDLSSLRLPAQSFLNEATSSSEGEEDEHFESLVWQQMNAFVLWSMQGSETAGPPDLHPRSFLAVDWEEAEALLTSESHASYGVEIVEICGGAGVTSYMCMKRRLRAGHNWELVTGTDLTDPAVQRKVMDYLRLAKPLVIVMAPVCTPYGPLGNWNRTIHREAWESSYRRAAPLAAFCGRVAQHQLQHGLYYVAEQPYPSRLWQEQPWPQVRADDQSYRIVVHQCMLDQRVNGQLVKKPTELVSNSLHILQQFANLQCDGSHQHLSLLSGRAQPAQKWSYQMCDRIARGIERLVAWLGRNSGATLRACAPRWQPPSAAMSGASRSISTSQAYPSVAAGAGDEGEIPVEEKWRKCKGCLWRLHRNDPMHSRKEGECKHPQEESLSPDCPACKARKNRLDPGHTFGPGCRHSYTKKREVRKRPYGRVPASSEPTSGLRASRMGAAEEQAAEEAIEPAPASAEQAPDASEPSSSSGIRRGRGPDVEARERRTWGDSDTQTAAPMDWSSFDLQATFRALRRGTEAEQRRLLRKLHLRWWHCSADRMVRLLKTAGFPKSTLDIVPSINDTCRVCRHWSRPTPDAQASSRMVVGFNVEVEGDLMFVKHAGDQHIVLVLTDRGVRWTSTALVSDRRTSTLLDAFDTVWVAIFGPPQVLLFDGEAGLNDDESTTYFQLRGITKRTAAPRQHTRIVDRKIAILRDTLHKLNTQLSEDGLHVPMRRLLCESTFALNSLTSVNGCSPYSAVLGRVPSLLPSDDALMSDNTSDMASKHTYRLRELCVQSIAEGSAKERMRRAMHTPSRPAAEEFEFRLGDSVDYWREPAHKDASGWRGPAVVADLTRLSHGRIGVRTSTDQVLTCRLQDVRHSLTFLSEELATFFGKADHVAPSGSQAGYAQQHVQRHVDGLRPGTVLSLGYVRTADGRWVETPQTATHRVTFQACLFIAETVFHMSNVAAVRLAHAVRSLTARDEYVSSLTLWWMSAGSQHIEFNHSLETKLSVLSLSGQEWDHVRLMQFMCVSDEEEWITSVRWVVPGPEPQQPTSAPESEISSIHQRLSTIPEASAESEATAVSLAELQSMFGESLREEEAQWLAEAYCAIEAEEGPARKDYGSIQELKSEAYAACPSVPDIPPWAIASISEECSFVTESQWRECLAVCDASPEAYELHDSDEHGAYVALEVYGELCKCVDGLDRLPNADEHVELRFYEAHTRKAVIDRSDDLLTREEMAQHAELVTQAMVDELKTWNGFKCFQRRTRASAPCIIDAKWVCKWKFVKGERKIRARLCLRGFKETGADDESNFAATATRFSQRLLVSEAALRGWTLASSDVPKAFLQGVTYAELSEATQRPERDVCFELSGEGLECLRLLKGFETFNARSEVLHCLKPGTGCRDAPKCFSLKLRRITREFGFVCSTVDPELEFLYDRNELVMIILKHVDDLKMAGAKARIEAFVAHLSKVFGKMEIEFKEFVFCGVRHRQQDDGSITLDQIKFLSACKPISHPEALSGSPTSTLSEASRRHFLSLLMTVAYGVMTRPDAAVFITALQRESHQAQVIHVKRLNAVLKWIQHNPRQMCYPKMQYPDTLLQISDSSYRAKSEDGLSVRGLVSVRVLLKDIQEGKKEVSCHFIDFVSKAQRHVTRSTFSSELFAATDSIDIGLLHSLTLHELASGIVSTSQAKSIMEGDTECSVALCTAIDARSVSAAVTAPNVKVPAEPSLLLHVHWVRSLLQRGRLKKLFWSDTRSMTADGMTKGSVDRTQIQSCMAGTLLLPQPFQEQNLQ